MGPIGPAAANRHSAGPNSHPEPAADNPAARYADGVNLTQLTSFGCSDQGLACSPDGTRIAFLSDRGGARTS